MKVVDCIVLDTEEKAMESESMSFKLKLTDDNERNSLWVTGVEASKDLLSDEVKVHTPKNLMMDNELYKAVKDAVLKKFSETEEAKHFLGIFGV